MKKAIILSSFGTSYLKAIECSFSPLKKRLEREFPEYEIFIAFSSKAIRKKLLVDGGIVFLSLEETLDELLKKEYEKVVVMPLDIMGGGFTRASEELLSRYGASFECLSFLNPILALDGRGSLIYKDKLIEFISAMEKRYGNIVFALHGERDGANESIIKLKSDIETFGMKNIYFFALEGSPSFEETCKQIISDEVKEVTLLSFLFAPGYHSSRDIFGDNGKSFLSKLKRLKIDIKVDSVSLGEREEFRELLIKSLY